MRNLPQLPVGERAAPLPRASGSAPVYITITTCPGYTENLHHTHALPTEQTLTWRSQMKASGGAAAPDSWGSRRCWRADEAEWGRKRAFRTVLGKYSMMAKRPCHIKMADWTWRRQGARASPEKVDVCRRREFWKTGGYVVPQRKGTSLVA